MKQMMRTRRCKVLCVTKPVCASSLSLSSYLYFFFFLLLFFLLFIKLQLQLMHDFWRMCLQMWFCIYVCESLLFQSVHFFSKNVDSFFRCEPNGLVERSLLFYRTLFIWFFFVILWIYLSLSFFFLIGCFIF